MGIETYIEWCDSSVNGQMGCDGCELWTKKTRNCYAGILTERYGGGKGWPVSFDKPAIFPDRLIKAALWSDLTGKDRSQKPWLNGLRRLIFLDDMGDTFTESLPFDWLLPHIPLMEKSPHAWQFLTKRPKRMRMFFEKLGYVPNNFWLGTSVTDQRTADARIPELLNIPARVRFLSVEPLLEKIDLQRWFHGMGITLSLRPIHVTPFIHWVIVGGESGHGKRPFNPDWARSIRDECKAAGVPFFMKQIDKVQPIPADLMIREFPK